MYRVDTMGFSQGVHKKGNIIYVADSYAGILTVINVSEPSSAGIIGFVQTILFPHDVFVDGDFIYVADDLPGLGIFNATNPANRYYINSAGDAYYLWVSNGYAYVVFEFSSIDSFGVYRAQRDIVIFDVKDPTNPRYVNRIYRDQEPTSVFVSENFLYISDSSSGLVIINVTDPSNPGSPVEMETAGDSFGIYLSENYAYIADGYNGLAIIDISDPLNPGNPVYMDTMGDSLGVWVSGNYAYLADYSSGLAIIDVSDPLNPGIPLYVDTPGTAHKVYVSEDYAFVADGFGGLAIIDLSDIITEILRYNGILLALSISLICIIPFGLIIEIKNLKEWIIKKKSKYNVEKKKAEKFKLPILSETSIGIMMGYIIGSLIGIFIGSSRLIPDAMHSATSIGVPITILMSMINGGLIGAILVLLISPVLKGAFLEICIGSLISLFVGGGIGASLGGVNGFITGIFSGITIGAFISTLVVILLEKLKTIIELKKQNRILKISYSSQIISIDETAMFAFDQQNFEKYFGLRCLSIELLIKLIYIIRFNTSLPDHSKIKEIIQLFEKIFNLSLIKKKDLHILDRIQTRNNENLTIDKMYAENFEEFYNLFIQKLRTLAFRVSKKKKIKKLV